MPPEKDPRWQFLEGQDLALNLESGIYYVVKSFRHLRIPNLFRSTKQTDIRKARKELPRLLKEHLDRHLEGKRKPGESHTIAEVIAEIERTESPGLRAGTRENRTMYFEELKCELGHMPIGRLSLSYWTNWLAEFRKKKTGRRTFWDYAKHMNILLRYAYEQKYVSHLVSLPNPDPKKATGTVLTTANIRLLFSVMNETTRGQLLLSYECCMRLREVLYLTWDRIDLETGEITLRPEDVKTGSKTGKGRVFVASDSALAWLRKRFDEQKVKSPWVFPSRTGKGSVDWNATAWKAAKEAALKLDAAFPHWARWHDLRHSALSHMLLDKGMSPVLVSQYAGVSILTIERVYLHSTAEKTRTVSQSLRITDAK